MRYPSGRVIEEGDERMYEWRQQIQVMVDEIDASIKHHHDEALTLRALSQRLGYSEFYATRKFREISGLSLRNYLRRRRLAFALIEVRDSGRSLLDIALDYGFSSHEAFTRAFRDTYGVTPSAYRKKPVPVVLRTKLFPFDRYFLGIGERNAMQSKGDIQIYFVTIPAHKFLHIRDYGSNGYWDFWQRQQLIPGHDWDTICGLLDSVGGKLDDLGGSDSNSGAGQIMAYLHDPAGQPFCYGVPRAECYGVRLPADYQGEVPPLLLLDVPEGEYIVFEHGPFDYDRENCSVEEKVNNAIATFDFSGTGYRFDDSPGRIAYFYHDPSRFWKEVRPICRV